MKCTKCQGMGYIEYQDRDELDATRICYDCKGSGVINEQRVSNCCGRHGNGPWLVSKGNIVMFEDASICPKCKDHCVYIPETEFKTV